jgi:hypothetical protein
MAGLQNAPVEGWAAAIEGGVTIAPEQATAGEARAELALYRRAAPFLDGLLRARILHEPTNDGARRSPARRRLK